MEEGPELAPEKRCSWREALLAADEIVRYDAVLASFGAAQPELLAELPQLAASERNQLLEALWQQVDVLLLEGRDKARPIFALACAQAEDPVLREHWARLAGFYRPASPGAPFDPAEVSRFLAASPEPYRRALARALLFHPVAEVRALARAATSAADCWQVLVSRQSSPRVLYETWQNLRGQVSDDLFKIVLTALAERLLVQLPREQLNQAARFVFAFFEVDAFHERGYLQLVGRIEKHLREQAAGHGIDLLQDAEYRQRLQTFAAAPGVAEQPIQAWSQVPLPVQRELARRGHFLRHFCCHQVDAVAVEVFPQLLRRDDIVEFLKILTINPRLLAQLAEEKQLFESDAAKFFLLANPRCPFHIIGKYMGYLTSESLTKLAQGYLYNNFARKQAERLLEQRGKARKPPR